MGIETGPLALKRSSTDLPLAGAECFSLRRRDAQPRSAELAASDLEAGRRPRSASSSRSPAPPGWAIGSAAGSYQRG